MLPFSGLWLALPQLELCGYSRAHLETIRFTPIWSQLVISELMLFLCRYVQRCWKQPASIVSLLNFLPNTGSLCTESLNSLLLTMDQSGSSNAFISIVHTMDFFFLELSCFYKRQEASVTVGVSKLESYSKNLVVVQSTRLDD